MSDSIRVWSVDGEALSELPRQPVDLESRLEDWMDSDVSVLSDDLLVIGRQLDTEGGGILDLLCLDRAGDVVIVELKRGKTPREVVAQALDYAAWAGDLSFEELKRLGDAHLADAGGLDAAFLARFDAELPDVLNAEHRLLVVASEIDPRSERIIRYLAETRGVPINAVTFNYFQASDKRELLARTHLIEPEVVEDRTVRRSSSKRRKTTTLEDHREEAAKRGVGDLYAQLVDGLMRWRKPDPAKSMVTFYFWDGKGYVATCNVITQESSTVAGLRFNAYKYRLARLFGLTVEDVRALLPEDAEAWEYSSDASAPENDWQGFTGAFRTPEQIDRFLAGLAEAPRQPGG